VVAAETGQYQIRLTAQGGYNQPTAVVLVVVNRAGPQATSSSWSRRAGSACTSVPLTAGGSGVRSGCTDVVAAEEAWMNAAVVIVLGVLIGAAAGVVFAWLAHGGYEANDAMIGTGFLGALLGALAGAALVTLRRRQ